MRSATGYKILFAAFLQGCIFLCGCENDEGVVNSLYSKKLGIEEATNVKLNYNHRWKNKGHTYCTFNAPCPGYNALL
jgi:hypothetical protein